MSKAIGQPGGAALPRPMGIGEILSTAFQLYQRHWRTLLAIAAVVVVPFTLVQYLIGDQVRARGEEVANGVVIETASWAVGIAGLVAALAGVVNAVITVPFGNTGWFVQAVVAAVATVVTLPYGVLVGVLLYLDLRARKEQLTLERLRSDLQASAT
jgi:hypothetical protein